MPEQFPKQFGKYVLLKSLARGGMGEIYLAASGQRGGLNKLCVIKKVISGKADRAKVNRFLDEAKVVLRLSHANLVSTFDAGDVGGELFIAMELVQGKDLREIWNRCVRTRTRIPVDVALVVVRETARALAYVHSYGGLRLVHRDVAPPNILLSYFGEVKLTDFGLARSILKQEHTAPGVVFGRASYLAPEQARGEVADARTDVYSLGIVLWELLTGQPYLQLAGLDAVTSLSLVRNPKPQPPSSQAPWIGAELDAVALKALAPDRADRFGSAEELRRELSEVMTRVAPRADSERVAEFLRTLYADIINEEGAERERLLAETVPRFRGERLPDVSTPRTDVWPAAPAVPASPALPALPALPPWPPGPAFKVRRISTPTGEGQTPSAGDAPTVMVPIPDHSPSSPLNSPPRSSAPSPAAQAVGDAPKESLHVSALRARAGSQARSVAAEASGADAPTKVWRKRRATKGAEAAQTFVGRIVDNRYRINHRIGEGGMGTVYAAEHVEIGKKVAVKILHRIFSGEEQLVERFRREARAASRVGHPHIIEVTDFGSTEEGCAYFVMELLEGLDLADVLVREGRLDPARTVRIAIQICQALEAAHASGIIHRDLKPENIFLIARDGQADFVKVLDFGIARNLTGESRRLTDPGMAMGTPEYMAPEQSQGKPADRRSDVYAVGALLHEMVLGVAPFQAETHQQMLEAKRKPLPPLRGRRVDIPAALDAIILRALAPAPEDRPQTMAQLEYELAKIVWGRPQAVTNLLGLKEREEPPPVSFDLPASLVVQQPGRSSGKAVVESPVIPAMRPPLLPAVGRAAQPPAAGAHDRPLSPFDDDLSSPFSVGSSGDDAEDAHAATETPPPPPPSPSPSPSPLPAQKQSSGVIETPSPSMSEVDRELDRLLAATDDPPPPPLVPVARPLDADLTPPPPVVFSDAPLVAPSTTADVTGAVITRAPAPRRAGVLLGLSLVAGVGGAVAWSVGSGGPGWAGSLLRWARGNLPGADVAGSEAAGAAFVGVGSSPPPPPGGTAPRGADGTELRAGGPAANESGAAGSPVGAGAVGVSRVAGRASGSRPDSRRGAPEIVQTPPIERARTAMAAGIPDDAVAVLRPAVARGTAGARPLLAEALVASGWRDVKEYHWASASKKAREAIALGAPSARSHGGHALLGEALYALGDFNAALAEFTKALQESPRDPRLKRRVIRSRRQLHRLAAEARGGAGAAGSAPVEATSEQQQ